MSATTLETKSHSTICVEYFVTLVSCGILAQFIDDMFENDGSKKLIEELLVMVLRDLFTANDIKSLIGYDICPSDLSGNAAKYYEVICHEPEQSSDS